jgi:ribosomal protein S14
MKFRLIYDRRLRRNFFRNEIYSIGFKFLISNYFLRTNILFFFNLMNLNFFHDFLSAYSKVKIVNYCTYSGRARGILNFFGVSRLSFRELAVTGLITGVRRAL